MRQVKNGSEGDPQRALPSTLLEAIAKQHRVRVQVRCQGGEPLFALFLPLGDLWLVHQAQAPASTLARHAAIGLILLAAWYFLRRWSLSIERSAPD